MVILEISSPNSSSNISSTKFICSLQIVFQYNHVHLHFKIISLFVIFLLYHWYIKQTFKFRLLNKLFKHWHFNERKTLCDRISVTCYRVYNILWPFMICQKDFNGLMLDLWYLRTTRKILLFECIKYAKFEFIRRLPKRNPSVEFREREVLIWDTHQNNSIVCL